MLAEIVLGKRVASMRLIEQLDAFVYKARKEKTGQERVHPNRVEFTRAIRGE